MVEARVRRTESGRAFNLVKGGEASGYESVPAVVRNPSVQRAKELEAEAEKKMQEMSQRYGPDHPRYVAAESDFKAAKSNTQRQVQTVVQSIQREFNVAKATEKTLEDALGSQKARFRR